MRRSTGMGIRLARPLEAVELAQGTTSLERIKLHGARRSGTVTDAAIWQAEYAYSGEAKWMELYPVAGALFERPDEATLVGVERELLQIEQDHRVALAALQDRKQAALARLVAIPSHRASLIEGWVAERGLGE